MKSKFLIFFSLVFAFMLILLSFYVSAVANPAYVYCEEMNKQFGGYEYKIKTDSNGDAYSICLAPDKKEYDSWAFLEGKVGQNQSYCAKKGYDIKTVKGGKHASEKAVCVEKVKNVSKTKSKTITSIQDSAPSPPMEINMEDFIGLDKKLAINESDFLLNEQLGLSILDDSSIIKGRIAKSLDSAIVTPSDWDWRNPPSSSPYAAKNFPFFDLSNGWISPVKDQASCGSCWSFATSAPIESRFEILQNNSRLNPNIAEQDLVSCGYYFCPLPYPNNNICIQGCAGGAINTGFEYVRRNGVVDESCYPYISGSLGYVPSCNLYRCANWQQRLWNVSSSLVDNGINFLANPVVYVDLKLTNKQKEQWIFENGAVYSSLAMGSDYGGSFDSNGIYRCTYDSSTTPASNHAITIVGFNDTGNTATSYWIIKNSWGANWNQDGYFKLGFNECYITATKFYAPLSVVAPNFGPQVVLLPPSPDNGNITGNRNIQFAFKSMNKISINSTCDLIVNNNVVNTTYPVLNNTLTSFSASLEEGQYNWKIQCWERNVGITNTSETRSLIIGAPIYLNVKFNSPKAQIYNTKSILVDLAASSLATSTSWYNNSKNLTYSAPVTLNLADGNYKFIAYAKDSANNLVQDKVEFSVDTTAPKYSMALLSTQGTYKFQVNWSDINGISSAILVLNNQNYTMAKEGAFYVYSVNDLVPGINNYKFWANDSLGNANLSINYVYSLAKNLPNLRLFLNGFEGNSSINYGSINVTTSSTKTTNVRLYQNNVLVSNPQTQNLSVGFYKYTAEILEGVDYSAFNLTYYLNVTKAVLNLMVNASADSAVSAGRVNIIGSNCPQQVACNLYRNNILVSNPDNSILGAGNYVYTYNSSGNLNYSAKSATLMVSLSKLNTTLLASSTSGWNLAPSLTTTIICETNNLESNLSLYENNVLIKSLKQTSVNFTKVYSQSNNYVILCNQSLSQNYTAANISRIISISADRVPILSNLQVSPLSSSYFPGKVYSFNVSVDDDKQVSLVIFSSNFSGVWKNISLLPSSSGVYTYSISDIAAGNYSYKWYANDSINQWGNSTLQNYGVSKLISSLDLKNDSATNLSYGSRVNITGFNCPNGASCNLYRNNVLVSNPDNSILPAGNYIYWYNASSSQNFTLESKNLTLQITKATSKINLYLENEKNNLTVHKNNAFLINASLENISETIAVLLDLAVINAGTNLVNSTRISSIGKHSIGVLYLGNENYTGSSETFYVNVTEDKVKPVIRLSPSNKARSVSSEKLDLSYVVSDDVRISNCSLILNGVVVATDSKVKKDTPQSFSRNFDKGNYSSNISCVDEASNTGYASLGVLVVEAAVASTSNATTPTYSSRGPDCNQTCLNLKYECGQQSVCGISTNCGSCASTKVCQNGKCITKAVSCIPECSGRSCGDDGCSGSCGECAQDQLCEAGLCKAKEVIVAPKEVAPSSNLLVYFGLGILGLLIISGIVVFFVVFYPKLMVKKPQTLNQVAEEETKLPKELVDGAKKLIVEYRKLKFDDAKIKSMFIQQGWTEKQINKIL